MPAAPVPTTADFLAAFNNCTSPKEALASARAAGHDVESLSVFLASRDDVDPEVLGACLGHHDHSGKTSQCAFLHTGRHSPLSACSQPSGATLQRSSSPESQHRLREFSTALHAPSSKPTPHPRSIPLSVQRSIHAPLVGTWYSQTAGRVWSAVYRAERSLVKRTPPVSSLARDVMSCRFVAAAAVSRAATAMPSLGPLALAEHALRLSRAGHSDNATGSTSPIQGLFFAPPHVRSALSSQIGASSGSVSAPSSHPTQ